VPTDRATSLRETPGEYPNGIKISFDNDEERHADAAGRDPCGRRRRVHGDGCGFAATRPCRAIAATRPRPLQQDVGPLGGKVSSTAILQ
jgi:hypothetical protein